MTGGGKGDVAKAVPKPPIGEGEKNLSLISGDRIEKGGDAGRKKENLVRIQILKQKEGILRDGSTAHCANFQGKKEKEFKQICRTRSSEPRFR